MVGAVVSSTMRERKPSATNSTTLCGRFAGVCAIASEDAAMAASNDQSRDKKGSAHSQALQVDP